MMFGLKMFGFQNPFMNITNIWVESLKQIYTMLFIA